MSNEDSSRKYFISFLSGLGLGIIITHIYYSNTVSLDQEEIVIKITDNKGNAVIKDYHYDKSQNTINFKDNLDAVNMTIILNGEEKIISKFSGDEIKLSLITS